MSSVYSLTTRPLAPGQKEALYAALGEALGETFRSYSMMFSPLPPKNCGGNAAGRTLVYVCVPPYMETDRRRKLIADLGAAVERVFGPGAASTLDVIFPYHSDDNCGVHGVMRSDALAAQSGRSAR